MDQRCLWLFLSMICFIRHSKPQLSFYNLTINNHFYFLSKTTTNATNAAAQCASQLPAELAFFDTNAEYQSVSGHLTPYNRVLKTTDLGIWIALNATVTKVDYLYEHWWKKESVDKGIWGPGEPDTFCLRPSVEKCCVRISWNDQGYNFLRDRKCSDDDYYLCKSHNECQDGSHNCSQSQVCEDRAYGFECICEPGYMFRDDSAQCVDVDECMSEPCMQVCINIPGSYNCSCLSGYDLDDNQHTCADVDECALGMCNHTCTNVNGSYVCACFLGYVLSADNVTCTDLDECAAQEKHCQQECVNEEGSFSCSCHAGYTLMLDNKTCESDDPCLKDPRPCPGPCVNSVGGYSCGCPDGFEDINSQCVDVDECTMEVHQCPQVCQNTEGSYTCTCKQGYRISTSDIPTCVDIDECVENITICNQTCLNSDGSFSCACNNGFTLDGTDNTSCVDINECDQPVNICQHSCNNTPGSFSCSCPLGYSQHEDGLSCVETSEPYECPCNCHSFHLLNTYRPESFNLATREMQRNISVHKHNVSAALRKKSSVQNTKTSAKAVGGSGVTILAIFFGLLILPDVLNVVRFVLVKYERLRDKRPVRKLRPAKF